MNTKAKYTPFVGVKNLQFGDSRTRVREVISGTCKPFKKTPFSKNYTDAFPDAGFHVYYDEHDKVEFIEAFPPAIVEYSEVVLSQGNRSEIEEELKRKGYTGKDEDGSLFFYCQGFALICNENQVEGVSLFQNGYYD